MKFLVITFDRYNTNKSQNEYFEGQNVEEVIDQKWDYCEDTSSYMKDKLDKVDDIFSCIAGEEQDILFYII